MEHRRRMHIPPMHNEMNPSARKRLVRTRSSGVLAFGDESSRGTCRDMLPFSLRRGRLKGGNVLRSSTMTASLGLVVPSRADQFLLFFLRIGCSHPCDECCCSDFLQIRRHMSTSNTSSLYVVLGRAYSTQALRTFEMYFWLPENGGLKE